MPTAPHLRSGIKMLAATAAGLTLLTLAGCRDDSPSRPPATGAPLGGTQNPPGGRTSVPPGGPQHTVLNNKPNSPGVNNAPTNSNGSG